MTVDFQQHQVPVVNTPNGWLDQSDVSPTNMQRPKGIVGHKVGENGLGESYTYTAKVQLDAAAVASDEKSGDYGWFFAGFITWNVAYRLVLSQKRRIQARNEPRGGGSPTVFAFARRKDLIFDGRYREWFLHAHAPQCIQHPKNWFVLRVATACTQIHRQTDELIF